MKQEFFTLPQMRELPQVTQVTRALRASPGVVDVLASATFHQIVVQYDNNVISAATIGGLLTTLGFAPVMEELPVRRPDGEWLAMSN